MQVTDLILWLEVTAQAMSLTVGLLNFIILLLKLMS